MQTELSNSELRRLDLTLLLVLLGLLRHRKARDVAIELGLTQSAISQALRRLRDVFRDPLFLRRPHGMEPTAVALALEAPVAAAVEALRSAPASARHFVPEAAEGILGVAALDAQQAVIVPPLADRLRRLAPRIRVSVLPLGRREAVAALADGRADIALGYIWDLPDWVSSDLLHVESFLVAGLPDTLPEAPVLSLDAYCAADHILVSPAGHLRGIVDAALATLGRERRVVLGLPGFLSALAAAANTGALVTLPSRVARAFAGGFGLAVADPPMAVRSYPVSAFWHRRNDHDPRIAWIRRQLAIVSGP